MLLLFTYPGWDVRTNLKGDGEGGEGVAGVGHPFISCKKDMKGEEGEHQTEWCRGQSGPTLAQGKTSNCDVQLTSQDRNDEELS